MGIDLRDKNFTILDEGVDVSSSTSSINFEGSGVSVASVGDNVTVTIPGGSGTTAFYLNQSITQTPYKEFSSVPTTAVEQVIPLTVAGGATSVIAEYMTPSGVPGTTQIPAGLWQLYLHFNAVAAGQNWIIRPTVYSRNLAGVETLLFTYDPEIVTGMSTTTTMFTCDGVFPLTSLLSTDRIVLRISMQNTTGVSQTVNLRTEGSQHYSAALTTLNQVVPGGGSSAGVFGISNAAGVYTYYSTLTLAMAAATSGQVIEMFADVTETGAVSITLKNGVNINGNGYIYTLNNSGLIHAFSAANSINTSCSILNLNLVRTGSTGSIFDNGGLFLGTGSSGTINCSGSTFRNNGSGCAILFNTNSAHEINHATAFATTAFGAIGIFSSASAKLNNSVGYGTSGGMGIRCQSGGDVQNCVGYSDSSYGIYGATGSQSNSVGISVSGNGFGANVIANNCSGKSASGIGFETNGGASVSNCVGTSVSGRGFVSQNANTYNCVGISSSASGVTLIGTSNAFNISSSSTSSYSLWSQSLTSKIYNGNIVSFWNNAAGYGIRGNSGSILNTISNCAIILTNASAPYIFNDSLAATISMRGNTYRGGAAFNANITQLITATEDNQGNIYL